MSINSNSDQELYETAKQHLVQTVPIAPREQSVSMMIEDIRSGSYTSVEYIYIVNEQRKLIGLVRLQDLIAANGENKLSELLSTQVIPVLANTDQERVAEHAIRYHLDAVPVVDKTGIFLGVVPAKNLLHVLRHEHIEDLHRLAGIRRETAQARSAIESPPARGARDRLPWLLFGLIGSMIATFVMTLFEETLRSRVEISFFIPAIVYLADAIGTQTEAIMVRGLSLSHATFKHLFWGEFRTGVVIGLVLSTLSFPVILYVFGDFKIAFSVTISLFAAGILAATVGLFLPYFLSKMGKDPAYGSGPIATIIQDILSLFIYFLTVRLLL